MNDFQELINKLCAPFPPDVHKQRHDGHGTYIPIHYYLQRLNEVAGEQWSHERVGEPIFYHEDRLVHTVVRVTILNRSHVGEGFSKYQVNEKGQIINRHYMIRAATKDAIRDAISFFGMGKSYNIEDITAGKSKNLHDRETQKNQETSDDTKVCIICDKALTKDDIRNLDYYKINLRYCMDHIPKHFTKKKQNQIIF